MSRDTGERIGHVVVMGTGEPFDNYDELLRAIRILHDENGLNIGLRNITVSTCGLLMKIEQFAEDMPQVNLAVSLHAADDGTRRKPVSYTHLIIWTISWDTDDTGYGFTGYHMNGERLGVKNRRISVLFRLTFPMIRLK